MADESGILFSEIIRKLLNKSEEAESDKKKKKPVDPWNLPGLKPGDSTHVDMPGSKTKDIRKPAVRDSWDAKPVKPGPEVQEHREKVISDSFLLYS